MENHKFCPFMSTANETVECSTECKINSRSPLQECVFEIIAKQMIVIENTTNEINATLKFAHFGIEV